MSNLPGSYDRLSLEAAAQLVDLGCVDGAEGIDADTALRQLKGAVAVYNRLSDARVVWLSDEVGMGKTFVALAVAALFRMANPAARILYLLPTSRLFVKWQTEHRRFFAGALPRIDHRAVTFGGQPVRELSRMPRLYDVATGLLQDPWPVLRLGDGHLPGQELVLRPPGDRIPDFQTQFGQHQQYMRMVI